MDHTKAAAGFGLLADPNRLRILGQLSQEGEQSATQLLAALPVSQPTLSHHMKILCDSGVVVGRKEGKWVHYRIDPEGSAQAIALLTQLTTCTAEAETIDCSCTSTRAAV